METSIHEELRDVCLNHPDDIETIESLIDEGASPLEMVGFGAHGYKQSLLEWLICETHEIEIECQDIPLENNIAIIKSFVRKGVCLNRELDDGLGDTWYALWDIQYARQVQSGIEIAKLLLETGANPNYIVDGETLYEYVLWKLVATEENCYEFQRQFIQLLLAYGGKAPAYGYKWRFCEKGFDYNQLRDLEKYQTFFREGRHEFCRDGYIIETETGKEIAWL